MFQEPTIGSKSERAESSSDGIGISVAPSRADGGKGYGGGVVKMETVDSADSYLGGKMDKI